VRDGGAGGGRAADPAFLCRQTDLLEAAGATGKPVNVKKGQFLHPEGMAGAVAKVRARLRDLAGGGRGVTLRDRGHGARLVLRVRRPRRGHAELHADARGDLGAGDLRRDALGAAAGEGQGGASGGAREFIPPLALAAIAAGADGLFMETHPDPDHAPSDGPNMVPLHQLDALVEKCVATWELVRG
jgi:2-dehydro-3-deoxyphosphooctonate aldolase (KDO 8-P synthase)